MRALVASGMFLIAATYGLARFGYGLFLPQFAEAFQMGTTASGAIQAGSFLSYCLAAVAASRMGARPRTVVGYAGTTAALGSVGVAVSPNAIVVAVSVVVAGAGAGFATPGLVTLIESNVTEGRRQENAQTVVNAGTGAGIVIAGLLVFLTLGQWRAGWVAIAFLAALATVATLRTDRSALRDRPNSRGPQTGVGGLAPLIGPLLAAVLAGASSAAIWTFGRSIMAAAHPEGAYSVLAWMALGAFGMLGAAAGKIVQTWSLGVAWALTSVAMAVATVALGLAPGAPLAAYTSVALFGASYTALSGVLIVWAVRVLPDRAPEGTVVLFIALAVGQATGSLILGTVLGMTSPAVAFTLAGTLGVLAVLPAVKHSAAGMLSGSSPALHSAPAAERSWT